MIAVQQSCLTISACNSRQVRTQGDGVQLLAGRRTRHLHAVWPPQPRRLFWVVQKNPSPAMAGLSLVCGIAYRAAYGAMRKRVAYKPYGFGPASIGRSCKISLGDRDCNGRARCVTKLHRRYQSLEFYSSYPRISSPNFLQICVKMELFHRK